MIRFRRLRDGSIEVRAIHPGDGLTVTRETYTPEQWAELVEALSCP